MARKRIQNYMYVYVQFSFSPEYLARFDSRAL